jgi:hypothetical protein
VDEVVLVGALELDVWATTTEGMASTANNVNRRKMDNNFMKIAPGDFYYSKIFLL